MTAKTLAKGGKGTAVARADNDDFSEFAGLGLETVTAADLLIPRLAILQKLSPQLDKLRSEYIRGAEAGMICEVATRTIFPDGAFFLPVYFRKDFIEWAPRNTGKGLVAIHHSPDCLEGTTLNEKRQHVTRSGNYIAETPQFFGYILDGNQARKCYVPFTSTQIKKAKTINTQALNDKATRADGSSYTPPLFYKVLKLTTAEEKNAEGSWFGWVAERGDMIVDHCAANGISWPDLKADLLDFIKDLKAGAARADQDAEAGSSDATSEVPL